MASESDLKMTVDEAIAFADEWSRGMTLHADSQGWRVVCLLLADEVRRLRAPSASEPTASTEAKDAERLDFMDRLCAEGCAPAIVNDDDGRWAFSDSGTSPVPSGDGPHTEWVSVTAFVEPVMWRSTIREAIDAAIAQQT